MNEIKRIELPISRAEASRLRAGDHVLLSGTAYSARDAAHLRMQACVEAGAPLPVELEGQAVFYLGPAPAKPGSPIGAAGPTSSYRMDAYTPALLRRGLRAMIGKGPRSQAVIDAVRETGGVYFAAVGGTAALLCKHITKCEAVAYADLGPEAIYKLELEGFPAIVALDPYGNDQYTLGPKAFRDMELE